ncbi:MAG: Smr/MutS family protein [Gammaproteobacteria bacterium]
MKNKDNQDAFSEAMRGVKPLTQDKQTAKHTRPTPHARFSRTARKNLLEETLSGSGGTMEQLAEEVTFRRPGVSDRLFRQLRRGSFSIETEIDLHGLRTKEAKIALRTFITESVKLGRGCVRVIHGKGLRSGPAGPVLKTRVADWLAQWEEVLALVSARVQDGGGGAIYVLLRKRLK